MTLELAHLLGELPLGADEPDFPVIAQDRTPLERGSITTAEPRQALFADHVLPVLVGDAIFLGPVHRDVEQGAFVYRSGELLRANSLPQPGRIAFDGESELSIAAYAREHDIGPGPSRCPLSWPPPPPESGPRCGRLRVGSWRSRESPAIDPFGGNE